MKETIILILKNKWDVQGAAPRRAISGGALGIGGEIESGALLLPSQQDDQPWYFWRRGVLSCLSSFTGYSTPGKAVGLAGAILLPLSSGTVQVTPLLPLLPPGDVWVTVNPTCRRWGTKGWVIFSQEYQLGTLEPQPGVGAQG